VNINLLQSEKDFLAGCLQHEMREAYEIIDFIDENQWTGGMSPHFSVNLLVNISGGEGSVCPCTIVLTAGRCRA